MAQHRRTSGDRKPEAQEKRSSLARSRKSSERDPWDRAKLLANQICIPPMGCCPLSKYLCQLCVSLALQSDYLDPSTCNLAQNESARGEDVRLTRRDCSSCFRIHNHEAERNPPSTPNNVPTAREARAPPAKPRDPRAGTLER